MGLTMSTTPSSVFPKASIRYVALVNAAVLKILSDHYAPEIENWMKDNASWEDRTGNARQALWAEATALVAGAMVQFGHGANIPYGLYLETLYSGKYAIIGPALDYFAPKIWADIKSLLGNRRGAALLTSENYG